MPMLPEWFLLLRTSVALLHGPSSVIRKSTGGMTAEHRAALVDIVRYTLMAFRDTTWMERFKTTLLHAIVVVRSAHISVPYSNLDTTTIDISLRFAFYKPPTLNISLDMAIESATAASNTFRALWVNDLLELRVTPKYFTDLAISIAWIFNRKRGG